MGFLKWIGAAVGWSMGGPIGAILGLALGEVIASTGRVKGGYSRSDQTVTQSGDFEISLLILSSVVIKSDGSTDPRELTFVQQQFVNIYGKERANRAFALFNEIKKQQIPVQEVCLQIKQSMDYSSRLQLLHFLFGVAKADGIIVVSEVRSIQRIGNYLGIGIADYKQIQAMFYEDDRHAYQVLGLNSRATIGEIKSAYRTLVKKYHPDKVIHLGPEHKKGAEEKFRQVQKAYETLQKKRKF